MFGDAVLRVVLQPEFVAPMHDLIPIFAIAFAFTTMRNFYFAQVIYFTNASYLELVVALLYLGVSTALSVLLVPLYGPAARRPRLMVACIVACLTFMVLGRRWYRMPIDLTALAVMPALAGLFVFGAHAVAELVAAPTLVLLLIDAAIFAVCGGFAVRRFDLLELGVSRCRRRKRNGAVSDERAQRHFGRRSRSSAAGSRAMPNFSACRFRCCSRWKWSG